MTFFGLPIKQKIVTSDVFKGDDIEKKKNYDSTETNAFLTATVLIDATRHRKD